MVTLMNSSCQSNTWKENMATVKPTIKEIEEWQAGLNGTAAYDVVSKPKHYMLFSPEEIERYSDAESGIEVRDILEKLVDKTVDSFNHGGDIPIITDAPLFMTDYVQLMQYLMRFMDKNGKEDLEKARWYLDKMIEAY